MSKPVARRLPALALPLLAAGLALLAGCATHPSSKSSWEPGAVRGKTYSTILVVGVSPNLPQRCAYERILARRLRNEGTLVAASCDAIAPPSPYPIGTPPRGREERQRICAGSRAPCPRRAIIGLARRRRAQVR